MTNYLVRNCITEDTFIVSSSDTLNLGDFISFYFSEAIYCGVVVEETIDSSDSVLGDTYGTCCECFRENELNLVFQICGEEEEPTEFIINSQAFCPEFQPPFFLFDYAVDDTTVCAQLIGAISDDPTEGYSSHDSSIYDDCDCTTTTTTTSPPRSANTENFICIPDCEFTGSTAVTPPHPVWTDGYGTPVTQLNMVVLGGPNGLNA